MIFLPKQPLPPSSPSSLLPCCRFGHTTTSTTIVTPGEDKKGGGHGVAAAAPHHRDNKEEGAHATIVASSSSSSTTPFSWVPANRRQFTKPRTKGITEIRGPYYTPMGTNYLKDIFETCGEAVDGLKFAGGSFSIMPTTAVRGLIDLAHHHGVYVSTGGWVEYVLAKAGPQGVDRYIGECADLGFDMVEVSSGFISLPAEDMASIVKKVKKAGLKAKAEVGVQFGAGGGIKEEEGSQGMMDAGWAITKAKRCLSKGADLIMVESEGITENTSTWRTDVIARFMNELGADKCMFEAADPEVFSFMVKHYGPEVNLFVDHSQVVQLECLRRGVWGPTSLWGKVHTYKPLPVRTMPGDVTVGWSEP